MPKEKQSEPDRTPKEAEKLAREVMKRMLQTPPTPHEKVPKKRVKRKSKSRTK